MAGKPGRMLPQKVVGPLRINTCDALSAVETSTLRRGLGNRYSVTTVGMSGYINVRTHSQT